MLRSKLLISLLILLPWVQTTSAQQQSVDDERTQAAESNLLRAQVERLSKEVDRLSKENADLRRRLAAKPAAQPATAPRPTTSPALGQAATAAKKPSKKTVYVLDCSGSMLNHFDGA
jgi:Mg-chelatase subunit ChlD